eukprot:3546726-Ditylum_brightwellii.AAC.1
MHICNPRHSKSIVSSVVWNLTLKYWGKGINLQDPDVCMCPGMRDDGAECWEYVLLYMDDVLCVSLNAEWIIQNEIGKYFALKESLIGILSIYPDGHVRKVQLGNG